MNNEYFDKGEKINKEYLDTLDLSKYLVVEDLDAIIDCIEYEYNNSVDLPEELQGCIFNFLSKDEIHNYLVERYDLLSIEDVVITYRLIRKSTQ